MNLKNLGFLGETGVMMWEQDPLLSELQAEEEVTPPTNEELAQAVAETGLFKDKTEYIIIGDEPRGRGVFDLSTLLDAESYAALKMLLTYMPRLHLREWFMKTVYPNLPEEYVMAQVGRINYDYYLDPIYGTYSNKKRFEDLIWAAFIDLFNQANLAYVNEKQVEPWTWEQEKLEALLMSKDKAAVQEVSNQINMFSDAGLQADPKAKSILEQFASLPKLGDTGLEINRQNAVKELLKQRDYETAQAIVNVFRFIDESEAGAVAKEPIPFDIVTEDGVSIKKT